MLPGGQHLPVIAKVSSLYPGSEPHLSGFYPLSLAIARGVTVQTIKDV